MRNCSSDYSHFQEQELSSSGLITTHFFTLEAFSEMPWKMETSLKCQNSVFVIDMQLTSWQSMYICVYLSSQCLPADPNINSRLKYTEMSLDSCDLFYILKDKFVFLHFKPYNKDIYDHIWCSTALWWRTVQSWELELIADVTASWKQRRSMCDNQSKNTVNVRIKRHETRRVFSGVPSCTNTKLNTDII